MIYLLSVLVLLQLALLYVFSSVWSEIGFRSRFKLWLYLSSFLISFYCILFSLSILVNTAVLLL